MEIHSFELYTFQLLHYFVGEYGYQMMTIHGQRQDVWLINRQRKEFPLICIINASDVQIAEKESYFVQIAVVMLGEHAKRCKLLLINTNPQSSETETAQYIHTVITPDHCEHTQVLECFPNIASVVHPSDEPQKEFARLGHSLELMQMRLKRNRRKALGIKRIPKLTGAIMLVCIIIFLLALMSAFYLENDAIAIVLWGAYYKMNVISMQEYWRLFTAGFLHIDLIHLFANMMALYAIGSVCEKAYSKKQYLIVLIASILMGNLFVFVCDGNVLGLGISGGIFGLLGAYIASLWESGMIRHPVIRSTVWQLIIVNFLISLLPGISLFAHLGGFISGIFLGIMFSKSEKWIHLRRHVSICFVLLLGMSVGLGIQNAQVSPLQQALDRSLLHTVRALGFDHYAQRMENAYLQYYSAQDLGLSNAEEPEK